MWLGISVEDGARLVWTFDGTEVAPEYVSTANLQRVSVIVKLNIVL